MTTDPFALKSLDLFCQALAAPTPIPGGGAAAAACTAIALAQCEMVANLSAKNSKIQKDLTRKSHLLALGERFMTERALVLRLAEEDAAAFALVMKQWKTSTPTPRYASYTTPGHEEPNPDLALINAAKIPLKLMTHIAINLKTNQTLMHLASEHLVSDIRVATDLLSGAARSASWTVKVNVNAIADQSMAKVLNTECADKLEEVAVLVGLIEGE